MRKKITAAITLGVATLLSGCAQIGDYYRVDRLINHASLKGAMQDCWTTDPSATSAYPGDAVTATRIKRSDCGETAPPINLDVYPAYKSAAACPVKFPMERGSQHPTIASFRALVREGVVLAAAATSAWKDGPLSEHDKAASMLGSIDRIVEHLAAAAKELDKSVKAPPSVWTELPHTAQAVGFIPAETAIAVRAASDVIASIDQGIAQGEKKLTETKAQGDINDQRANIAALRQKRSAAVSARDAVNEINTPIEPIANTLANKLGNCEFLRDRLLGDLMSRSDELCDRHKGDIHATAAATNLGLGVATTLLSGAGALVTGQSAQVHSALAAATNSIRSQVSEQIYQQQFVGAITAAIDWSREQKRGEMEGRRLLTVNRYNVDDAVRDAQDYHFRCGFHAGLTQLREIIAKQSAEEPARIQNRTSVLDAGIAKLVGEFDKATTARQRNLLDFQLEQLREERQRLHLRRSAK